MYYFLNFKDITYLANSFIRVNCPYKVLYVFFFFFSLNVQIKRGETVFYKQTKVHKQGIISHTRGKGRVMYYLLNFKDITYLPKSFIRVHCPNKVLCVFLMYKSRGVKRYYIKNCLAKLW